MELAVLENVMNLLREIRDQLVILNSKDIYSSQSRVDIDPVEVYEPPTYAYDTYGRTSADAVKKDWYLINGNR
jgi:hypothetical protein